jgi:hypothetical protein
MTATQDDIERAQRCWNTSPGAPTVSRLAAEFASVREAAHEAGRREGIEVAAQECDSETLRDEFKGGAHRCAWRIRALPAASKPKPFGDYANEDDYYEALGTEIEAHPIGNPAASRPAACVRCGGRGFYWSGGLRPDAVQKPCPSCSEKSATCARCCDTGIVGNPGYEHSCPDCSGTGRKPVGT